MANYHAYKCSAEKCPKKDEVQMQPLSPAEWTAQAQNTPVLCLACGHPVEYLGVELPTS